MSQPPNTDDLLGRVLSGTGEVLSLEDGELSKDSLIREELGADSLDLVTLVWALEEEFGGKIEESELDELSTPQKIAEYILDRIEESTSNEA